MFKIKTQEFDFFPFNVGYRAFCTTLLMALLFWVGLLERASFAQGLLQFDHDQSKSAVSVDFGNTKYTIPKTYLPGITPLHKTEYSDFTRVHGYAAFSLNIGLPDFSAGMPDNDPILGKGHGKGMRVLAEYMGNFKDMRDILNFNLNYSKRSVDNFTMLENGCKLYVDNKIDMNEWYACELPDHFLLVDCNLPGSVPSPGCTVRGTFADNSNITYHYGRNFVGMAVEIDRKLRALIASFAAVDSQNSK